MKRLTLDAVQALLRRIVAFHGTQVAAAAALGVSMSDFNRVIRGNEAPGPKLLKALGLKRVTFYEEVAP